MTKQAYVILWHDAGSVSPFVLEKPTENIVANTIYDEEYRFLPEGDKKFVDKLLKAGKARNEFGTFTFHVCFIEGYESARTEASKARRPERQQQEKAGI